MVLTSKYGGWSNLDEERVSSHQSIWWRDLKGVCGSGNQTNWFESLCEWKVGNGSQTRFWLDMWFGLRAWW